MKENLVELAVIVDRSGSMSDKLHGAIEGYNAFVDAQKAEPGEAVFTLVLFDHEYLNPLRYVPIAEVVHLTTETYVPRGNTALYDAIGTTVIDLGARLSVLPEEERPAKVIVAVLTDGMENASREFTHDQIAEMIKHQQDVYGWEFLFLASDLRALQDAQKLNFAPQNTMAFAASSEGTQTAYRGLSEHVSRARNG